MEQNDPAAAKGNCCDLHPRLTLKEEILLVVVRDLAELAKSCNKELTEKMLKNLFRRKRAYQRDWTQQTIRRKAFMLAGYTMLAIGGEPSAEELHDALQNYYLFDVDDVHSN
jgi:hypothetical protein